MATTLAGLTYEVFTADGERWIYESTHAVRSAALEHAEELLGASGSHYGVRVVAENESTGEQEILFEEKIDRDGKVISLVAISDAPVCKDSADFYAFPARRTAGRLLRNLLDDQGMTSLELAFDPGQLMMFERNDKMYGPAMQRVGGIQAKAAVGKTANRTRRRPTAHSSFCVLLCRGRVKPPKNPRSCIVKLNDMMANLELPLTQKVLLERVEIEIGGTHPLTKEGKSVNRDAFVGLVRELVSEVGLPGGSVMSEALIKRARITLSSGDDNLTFEQAIDSLIDLMPNRAVRLGFLLDLGLSSSGKKEMELIKQSLDRIVKQLNFLASLVPDASGSEKVKSVVEVLRQRLDSPGVPADWKNSLAGELDALVERSQGGSGKTKSKQATKSDAYKLDIGSKDMNDPTGERKSVKAGDIILEEGEVGNMAYLIISGEVEIFRTTGNRERVLATLDRGEIIGEMSLIDNAPRMASARALSDTELSIISRDSLQNRLDSLEKSDRVLRRLIAVLVSRIRGEAQSPE